MAISTAVPADARSEVLGYDISKKPFVNLAANLPQYMMVVAEANTDKQSGLDTTPFDATNAAEVADRFGYGSPAHICAVILFPPNGGRGATFPITFVPVASDVAATPTTTNITVTTASVTANKTHYVKINGRTTFQGRTLSFDVLTTDNQDAIALKIQNVIAQALYTSCPVTAAINGTNANQVDITTKWEGATSAGLNIEIDVRGTDTGVTYTIATNTDGTGSVSLASALDFGDTWYTILLNTFGESQFSVLEAYNGNPDNKSGRHNPLLMKPFMAIWGSTLSDKDALLAITDIAARETETTNVLSIAPNSKGWDFEAAANGALLHGNMAHNAPHLDIIQSRGGESALFPDMPVPEDGNIGDLKDYAVRNQLWQGGCSASILVNGKYKHTHFITTYHPADNTQEFFINARDINIDWNVVYSTRLIQEQFIAGYAIGRDNVNYTVSDVVTPALYRQKLITMENELEKKALIQNASATSEQIQVSVGLTNPDRFDSKVPYQISGYTRVLSNTAEKQSSLTTA